MLTFLDHGRDSSDQLLAGNQPIVCNVQEGLRDIRQVAHNKYRVEWKVKDKLGN